jgi:tetratricopeptide repeat protein
MPTSEIEKLERRYAENPQGLTFAPLAEIHRKGGDVPRALELLRAGLELHPNYIPASIVLGRCHWDLGDLPAADAAFAHVLRLDDENVIALKSLADINERLERFAEAQRWLQRLVSVDRSNEEARQQLARLETAKERGDKPTSAPPPKSASSEPAPPETAAVAKPVPPPAAVAPPAPPPTPSPAAPKPEETNAPALEFLDISGLARTTDAATPAPAESPGEPVPVDGLISQEFVPPKEATYRLHPELTQEFVSAREPPDRVDVELTEDIELRSSGAPEFRVPNAAEDFMELAARMNAAREETPTLDSGGPATVEPPAAEIPVPEPPAPPPPPADRKDTAPPADRKDAAPPRTEVPPALGGLQLITDTDTTSGGQSFAARDTKGQSVASFFKALLAARPSGNSGHQSPGSAPSEGSSATRPPQDVLSLSSVLGGEGPANPSGAPAPDSSKDAAVSFDDFFASAAGGASPLPPGSSEPSNDDLDQFQTWLQNLKR